MTGSGRYLFPLALAIAFIYFLRQVHEILLPFILGGTLAYLLNPSVRFFEIRGLRRKPVVIVIYLAMVFSISSGTYWGVSLASQEASKTIVGLPVYLQRGAKLFKEFDGVEKSPISKAVPFLKYFPTVRNLSARQTLWAELKRHLTVWPTVLLEKTPSLASNLLLFLELNLLVPFIAFFFMIEGPAVIGTLLGWVPARYVEMVFNIIVEIDNSLGNYVRGLCFKSFLIGLAAWAGYRVVGLDYALQLSILTGLTNFIPLIGPVVAILISGIVAICQWGTLSGLLKVLLIGVLLRLIDDGVLQFLVFKNSVQLHPVLMLFALMAGGALWGFWGLLFAVPLACMVKVLLEVAWQWYTTEYDLRPNTLPIGVSHIPLV